MSVLTLGPVGGICRTPIAVTRSMAGAELIIQNDTPLGKWLNLVYSILSGVGPQLRASATLNFPNTAAQTSSELTVSVPGARITDSKGVSVTSTVNPANSYWTAYVSADDVVTVRFNNYSAGAINPASGDFSVIVST